MHGLRAQGAWSDQRGESPPDVSCSPVPGPDSFRPSMRLQRRKKGRPPWPSLLRFDPSLSRQISHVVAFPPLDYLRRFSQRQRPLKTVSATA
jgi:hypothetical protein